jgi:type I restriction-modification system DNA methylase subunit
VVDKETAKQQIKEFIDKYNKVVEENRIGKYNEEMTKAEFIEPLFEALGWDVRNKTHVDEVSREEKVSKKRVDYGFRINGIPKFFLEAKPLKADLHDPKIIGQAIDYAWAKGCTWAVLTDFESVMIFNAEWRTEKNLMQNLFREIPCQEFLNRFDELWLLSKESFEQGLLDKEAEKLAKKAKMAPIDQHLLNDFSRWRNALSKNISLYNKDMNLTEEQLDEAVQKLLNRLVFIRKAEDAELEEPVLKAALRAGDEKPLYVRLREIFRKFEEIYDSELFEESLIDQVTITNDVLKEVIEGLYYPAGKLRRYDFSIIDADVLGNVYEQYLGNILKKTKKRVEVKESHARRKEQGIYYTPTYIVDYIVRNTLGELLKDKKVDVEKIRVLDPACGSGSFLIKAFDVLNEHYSKHDKDYAQTQLDTTGQGTTFTKKVEILQNNIFGVDLDKQAVEIARLNLLLKIAEKGQRLPLLRQNIKCGNSLIDDEKVAGDKAFKWEQEFKQMMDEGGFDVVIGNPPYGAELNEQERDFISRKFEFSKSYKNTALIFIERSLDLLKQDGYFGMIVPKSIAFSQLWKPGRELIKEHLVKVVDVSKAFEDVLLEQVIIILNKAVKTKSYILQDIASGESIVIDKRFIDSTDSIILHGEKKDFEIFKKMIKSSKYLSEITKTSRGLPFQKHLIKERTKYPVIKGKTISRYNFEFSNEYLPEKIIEQNKNKVKFLQQPKIISQRIVAHVTKPKDHIIIMSALDKNGLITVDTVENTVITNKNYTLEFLLCLLNSKLISWYAYRYIFSKAIRTMDLDDYYLGKISLPDTKIDNFVFTNLVNKMLLLSKSLNEIGDKKTDERQRIEEEIKRTDAEIDELVYKLYGITEEEKKVIEESLE